MKPYIITYDLKLENGNSKDYKTLAAAIKKTGVWCRPTDSTWIVKSQLSALEIYNTIRRVMDSNDLLFIAELAVTGNWIGFMPTTITMLNPLLDG
ncbi:MAG: SinR family protein [Prosthecobacter sp.]|nr:SinR family protein [Prosthecobacter sp.]